MYKFKLEVLVIISKMLERADLDEEKAKEIIGNQPNVKYSQLAIQFKR